MPTLFKTLERVVLYHLEDTCLVSNPLHQNQFAFRKQVSTEHALSKSVATIEKGLNSGMYVVGVYLDIRGAFDNIKPHKIIESFRKKKFPSVICSWYEQYLTNRVCVTEHSGTYLEAKLERGTPQGGILSTLCWNSPMDSFLKAFDNKPTTCIAFADDAKLLTTGIDFPTALGVRFKNFASKSIALLSGVLEAKTAHHWKEETFFYSGIVRSLL